MYIANNKYILIVQNNIFFTTEKPLAELDLFVKKFAFLS